MSSQDPTGCTRFPVETLSAYADGDLPGTETQLVRAHLADCAQCAGVLTEIGALASAARAFDRPEPPPSLWPAVAGALEKQDRPWWLALRLFGTGALAGAAAVSVAALALSSFRGHESARAGAAAPTVVAGAPPSEHDPLLDEAEAEFAHAAAAYESSIEKLRGLIAREEPRWTADERALYSERLVELDDAIARSREIARKSPADSAGNEQLFAAYQQKISFLAEAVHRGGAWNGGDRP